MKKLFVILFVLAAAGSFAQANSAPEGFVFIKGGTFIMGSPEEERGRNANELQHRVTVSSFYMDRYEVQQSDFEELMEKNPSLTKRFNLPVFNVTWIEAVEYCNKLSQKEGLTPAYTISGSGGNRTATWNREANGYRLPTEAEWEYACRAGTTTVYNTGDTISDDTGWYKDNSGGKIHPSGEKPANAWGLYDMHGNVLEWCWDLYGEYRMANQTDPTGSTTGTNRIKRGGSWGASALYARSAYRNYNESDYRNYVGFRLVRSAQ